MESHAASKIKLIKALEYSVSQCAPYIQNRASVDFHPSGSAVYAGQNGSKVCRFELGANVGAFLDLSTLYVSGTVFNTSDKAIQFLSPSLAGSLSSARVIISGVEVSSCDYISRTEELLSRLGSNDEKRADFEAGFGLRKGGSYRHLRPVRDKPHSCEWQSERNLAAEDARYPEL